MKTEEKTKFGTALRPARKDGLQRFYTVGAVLFLCGAFGLSAAIGGGQSRAVQNQAAQTPEAAPQAPVVAEELLYYVEPGYFPTTDGLFRPEDPFTPREAAEILLEVTGRKIPAPTDETFTEASFSAFLRRGFSARAVEEAVALIRGLGSETVTRAEAAVCLNRLLKVAPDPEGAYYPDVEPDYWAAEAVLTAAGDSGVQWSRQGPAPEGFLNVDGWLYRVDETGYFVKNRYVGTLFFDGNGRYTSGSQELDGYVAAVIRQVTDPSMDREEMLRAAYEYVRDNFTYLRRNYYNVGDVGWQLEEALTMYSTGRGNCYCYASAFWAAARGLGYDAKIVSGTFGAERSPHGWVEILQAGQRYTYDVEIEMARLRDGRAETDMYAMTDAQRGKWNYVEQAVTDNMVARETNPGLEPQ